MIGLIPSFGNAIWTFLAFIVTLSVIVAVHEYGHYIVGRWSGIQADVFSLGFGPTIYSRVDKRGTRWQIAALPFGGFVKFRGDSDAASGKDGDAISRLSAQERRATMHGAPLWARSATVLAGPMFNFALSILIFAGFFMVYGIATNAPVVGSVKETPFAGQSLQPGDRILSINGEPTPDLAAFGEQLVDMSPAPDAQYRVERDGKDLTLTGPFPFPPLVDGVQPQSAAYDAGLKAGDVILAIDGTPIQAFSQLRQIVGDSDGRTLKLTIWRDGREFEADLAPRRVDLPLNEGGFETRWLIGLSGGLVFVPETRTPGPFEAMWLGVHETWRVMSTSLSGLVHIISGAISTCNLSGPLSIAETSGAAASMGISSFVQFVALLSTAVGLMNLFPVPVLDGGHLVFHAYEAVTGRPPSDRVLRVMMMAGLGLLLSLMLFAVGNDIFCP